jgi:hypothetical protein
VGTSPERLVPSRLGLACHPWRWSGTTGVKGSLRVVDGGGTPARKSPLEAGYEHFRLNRMGNRASPNTLVALDRQRILRGWTRGELARRSHVDAKTLSTLLRNRPRPALGTVLAACRPSGSVWRT